MANNANKTTINYSIYFDTVDLSGKDLLSVFGQSKNEFTSSTGLTISEHPVKSISVPTEKVTSMRGEIADEVHEWPNANQGASFHSLSLHFRGGLLIALEWNFSLEDYLPKKTPWYRKWI